LAEVGGLEGKGVCEAAGAGFFAAEAVDGNGVRGPVFPGEDVDAGDLEFLFVVEQALAKQKDGRAGVGE